MKSLIKKTLRFVQAPFIVPDYWQFYRRRDRRFALRLRDLYPCLKDKTITTGFDRHYVYFTAWAARKVADLKPERHIDISSSLYFSGIVSAFVPVDFYDYRPADLVLPNFSSQAADLTALPFPDNSITSLSCLHVIEHIGLGRYGDPIDPEGDQKAGRELTRVLAPGGSLLFATPVGATARIEYNAHRIYSYEAVLALFPSLTLEEFTLIPERSGAIVPHADPAVLQNERYACGCFHFIKPNV